MEHLVGFWNTYRNEILTTGVAILAIHLITTMGGFVSRVGGAKRVAGTGIKPTQGPDGTP